VEVCETQAVARHSNLQAYIESDSETQKKFSQPLTFLPAGEAMPNLALHAVVTIQRNRG
jgi:hypothetical protein